MSFTQIEKSVEEILGKSFDTVEDFDKEIEPHISGSFKSAHYFIRLIMISDNTEIKNKIFHSAVVSDFLNNQNQRIIATNILSDKKFGSEEVYQDEDRVFLLDLYPFTDFASPIKNAISEVVKEYNNKKEIIFYDIDNKWKIIKIEVVTKIDDEHEKIRQEILDEAASGKFDPELLPVTLTSDWLRPKYKEEKVISDVEDYAGWIPDNFQQVLVAAALTHS